MDGHSVEIYQLPIPTSLKVLTRLSKILARPIGSAISSNVSNSKSVMDNPFDIGEAVSGLSEKLDEEIVISTINMLLPYLHIDGKSMKTLESFDDLGVFFMLKCIGKSLEVNYSDFFVELLERGAEEKKKKS